MARVKTESTTRGRVATAGQVCFVLAVLFGIAGRPGGRLLAMLCFIGCVGLLVATLAIPGPMRRAVGPPPS